MFRWDASCKTIVRLLAAIPSTQYNSNRCHRSINAGQEFPHSAATRAAAAQTTIPRNFHMPQLYDNPDQEALHLKAMKSLAIETGHDFSLVRQIYEVELARLQAGAHIRDYVLLLSARRAREALRKPAKPVRLQPVTHS
jgi:hypothetical protein